jgi:hypothetical protein
MLGLTTRAAAIALNMTHITSNVAVMMAIGPNQRGPVDVLGAAACDCIAASARSNISRRVSQSEPIARFNDAYCGGK